MDEVRAKRIIEKRSQWFLSRNLRWTSQGVAFAKTDSLVHGGNAWNALQGLSESVGSCLALFYNSIFGAIVRQAFSQSTQAGRALLKIKDSRDCRALTLERTSQRHDGQGHRWDVV